MERIELVDGVARAEVVPERGAIVSRFDVADVPILCIDRATLEDPTKNVRGGVPFLFPTAGRLEGDRYRGREMKQHGFARNMPFAVTRRETHSVTLSLGANDESRARFPFEFRIELTISVSGSVSGSELCIAQRYQNLGAERMPLHVGFHPYFFIPDAEKRRVTIETHATRAFDNAQKRAVPFAGFDFTRPEVDLHLDDHGGSRASLRRPGVPTVEVEGSPEFGHWVVWALAGKDFICVEPWTAPRNALNSGEQLLWVEPAADRSLTLSIRLV
jgi:galactose mutarotase-like enzyme